MMYKWKKNDIANDWWCNWSHIHLLKTKTSGSMSRYSHKEETCQWVAATFGLNIEWFKAAQWATPRIEQFSKDANKAFVYAMSSSKPLWSEQGVSERRPSSWRRRSKNNIPEAQNRKKKFALTKQYKILRFSKRQNYLQNL